MRRRPHRYPVPRGLALLHPGPGAGAQPFSPAQQGDRVKPFLQSGGTPRWLPAGTFVSGDPPTSGFQMLCSQYVGRGQTGFVKLIKAAPYKPSILHNAEYTELVPGGVAPLASAQGNNPDSDNGWWSTPMGWEGYQEEFEGTMPLWVWHLRLISGTVAQFRKTRPAFSFLDPESWQLIPNLPVPASTYGSGLPGDPPVDWPLQRMQWFGKESGEVHIPIPEDTTVALFAEWRQTEYIPFYQATNGAGIVDLGRDLFVLGPSFGQLVGYTQASVREAASHNAVYGWGS